MSETQQGPEIKVETTTPVANGLDGSQKSEGAEAKTPAAPPVVEKTAEDKRIAAKFAALSKRDKETIARAQQLAEKERLFAAKEAELVEQTKEIERIRTLKQRAKEDPTSYLAEAGIDYNYLTKYHLNDSKRPEDDVQEDKLKELKQEVLSAKEQVEAVKKAQEDAVKAQQQKEIQKTVDWYTEEVSKVYADENKYPLTRLEEGTDIIFDIAAKHLIENNEIVDLNAVAPELERYYEEQWRERLKNPRIMEIFNEIHAPKAEIVESKEKEPTTQPRYIRPKTISNSQVLSDPNAKVNKPITREERLRAALKHL